MKKKIGFFALIACCAALFSGCELLALFNFVGSIADYNTVYVKNGTGSSITVKYEEDANTVSEGATRQTGSFTLSAGQIKEKAFSAGDFKLTIGDKQVMPGEGASKYAPDEGYYGLYANSLITITGNATEGYTYTAESRPSNN